MRVVLLWRQNDGEGAAAVQFIKESSITNQGERPRLGNGAQFYPGIARKAPSFRVGLDIGATNAHPLADPAQVQQLLQINLCPHCDLSG